jgi:hypothetical protein
VLHNRTSRSPLPGRVAPSAPILTGPRETSYDDRLKLAVEQLHKAVPARTTDQNPVPDTLSSKTVIFCDFLVNRIGQHTDAARILGDIGRLAPSLMLTRSVVEATIMLCWLHAKIVEFLKTNDRAVYERFLASGNFGTTGSTPLDQACNVVMTVDRLDREAKGFKDKFDLLCGLTDLRYAAALGTAGLARRAEHASSPDAKLQDRVQSGSDDLQALCLTLAEKYVQRITEAFEARRGAGTSQA